MPYLIIPFMESLTPRTRQVMNGRYFLSAYDSDFTYSIGPARNLFGLMKRTGCTITAGQAFNAPASFMRAGQTTEDNESWRYSLSLTDSSMFLRSPCWGLRLIILDEPWDGAHVTQRAINRAVKTFCKEFNLVARQYTDRDSTYVLSSAYSPIVITRAETAGLLDVAFDRSL